MELERLTPHQFQKFRDFIYQACGIRIDDKKVSLLSNRVRRCVKAGSFENFDDYYRYLTSSEGTHELDNFLDAITTNETFFFRTEKHFEWFKTEFIEEMESQHRAGRRDNSLRIWSAGCANGAEPYSIAICLAENIYRLNNWSLSVLGTDISEQALAEARRGRFKSKSMEAVSLKQRQRFFRYDAQEDHWKINAAIQERVEFEQHNLMQPLTRPPFDCVWIRNVLIYFDKKSKQTVIGNLIKSMAKGGYLVVGPSEGIYDMLDPLTKISPFLYRKT